MMIAYLRSDGRGVKRIQVDTGEPGGLEFAEQELTELQWFPSAPSDEERAVVERILHEVSVPNGLTELDYCRGELQIVWHR